MRTVGESYADRTVCAFCGVRLQEGDRLYCHPDTGRPCRQASKAARLARDIGTDVIDAPGARPRVAQARVGGKFVRLLANLRAGKGPASGPLSRGKGDTCGLCGAPIAPAGGRGRPQVLCRPETGRPCRSWARQWSALRSLSGTVISAGGSPRIVARFVEETGGSDLRYQSW